MTKILAIVLLAFVAAPAAAQPAATQASGPAAEKAELDRIVCERQESIGTRLGARKVCKTVKEWQEERRVQREETEGVQRIKNGMQ